MASLGGALVASSEDEQGQQIKRNEKKEQLRQT
jgi:hypothetical protein